MTNQQQEREARAREVLAAQYNLLGAKCEIMDGGKDRKCVVGIWAALQAMLAFSDAERAASAPASTQGYRLVPVEPTPEMVGAGYDAWMECDAGAEDYATIYRAMIAAVPQAEPEHVTSTAGVRVDEGGAIPAGDGIDWSKPIAVLGYHGEAPARVVSGPDASGDYRVSFHKGWLRGLHWFHGNGQAVGHTGNVVRQASATPRNHEGGGAVSGG